MGDIAVTGLGKAYKHYPNRWGRLADWLFPGQHERCARRWVLEDISFSVHAGEAVGIIGLNGAGKSTLLKMIIGTTRPTTGSVRLNGRVTGLLELGLGFHPDFTGRQNAVLGAHLQGYDDLAVQRLIPEIEAFAEIGDYFDQPVRIYSTGMQMRLAFALSTVERPDILILDEALSVGDAYFQHKSFDRIRLYAAAGTTLLLVSHDKQAIQSLCDRAILLDHGRIAMDGETEAVLDYYNALLAADKAGKIVQRIEVAGKARTDSGSGEARMESIGLFDTRGRPLKVVAVGQPVEVRIPVNVHADLDGLVMGCGIKDRFGQMMFGTNTFFTGQAISAVKAGTKLMFRIRFDANLGEGTYSIHASLVRERSHLDKNYHWIDRGYVFEVVNMDRTIFVGASWNAMRFLIDAPDASFCPDPEQSLVVVDVGCRWGFAESFTVPNGTGRFRVYGFDPDQAECTRLEQHYAAAGIDTVTLVPLALAGKAGRRTLHETREPACSSLLEPDGTLTEDYPSLACAQAVARRDIDVTTLNDWARDTGVARIDYIKLDTQGSELEILRGAGALLESIRCIDVEVEFNPIYLDQPLFADVDRFLRQNGFVLWQLGNMVHYSHRLGSNSPIGEASIHFDDAHRHTHPVHGGQLFWAEARYVQSDVLTSRPSDDPQRQRDEVLFRALKQTDLVDHFAGIGIQK
jgi:lipopolysaccharide transport system ATP-binding protein